MNIRVKCQNIEIESNLDKRIYVDLNDISEIDVDLEELIKSDLFDKRSFVDIVFKLNERMIYEELVTIEGLSDNIGYEEILENIPTNIIQNYLRKIKIENIKL